MRRLLGRWQAYVHDKVRRVAGGRQNSTAITCLVQRTFIVQELP